MAFEVQANSYLILVQNRQTKQTSFVDISKSGEFAFSWSNDPDLSADGRFVSFYGRSESQGAGIFIHDLQTKRTQKVADVDSGKWGSFIEFPRISADGRFVIFCSFDSNLTIGNTNGAADIFVHDRIVDKTQLADLKITTTQKPLSLKTNSTGIYQFTVNNSGSDTVNDLRLPMCCLMDRN